MCSGEELTRREPKMAGQLEMLVESGWPVVEAIAMWAAMVEDLKDLVIARGFGITASC